MTRVTARSGDRWLDPDVDPVVITDEDPGGFAEEPDETFPSPPGGFTDPGVENLVNEFVDLCEARDYDGVQELLTEDAEANLLDSHTRQEVAAGLLDLCERYPSLLLTRGELGDEPVAAVWVADALTGEFGLLGLIRVACTDGPEPLIARLDLVEIGDGDDVLLECPDAGDLAEWEDRRTIDEG